MSHGGERARFDTLIVGAGSAGVILATRLSEDPGRSVCLIEAGPDYLSVADLPERVRALRMASARTYGGTPIRSHEWGYSGRGSALLADMPIPRGRVIGGSSSINGTVLLRALRSDLDEWSQMGNPGWDYSSCAPYFRKLEGDRDFPDAHHGADGPVPVSRAARKDWVPLSQAFHQACTEVGFADCPDMNTPDARGVGPIPCNYLDGLRYSTAISYLMPVRPRDNLVVRPEALVTRILFEGRRARGVEVVQDERVSIVEADEVIISAGGIGSPHLLMLSGIGPAQQLRSVGIEPLLDLPGVGQHMRDHPFATTIWSVHDGIAMPDPPSGLPFQLQVRATAPGSTRRDDAWITMITQSRAPYEGRGFSMPASLMYASSQGEVKVTSADPTVAPDLDFRYFSDPTDLERLCNIVRLAVNIGSQAAFDSIRQELVSPGPAVLESQAALEDWVTRIAATGHHVSCTCRMGPQSDPLTVVDAAGRVHGLEGVRVIDASIMPDCPSVNLNSTVMMMAEKLADELRGVRLPPTPVATPTGAAPDSAR